MAVNRFDRPLRSNIHQNYVSQYVPMPLDAYVQAMGAKQSFRDNEIAQAMDYQSKLLNMRSYGNADTEYLKAVQGKFTDYVDEIADKDLTDPAIYNKLRSMIRTTGQDPNLKTIQGTVAQYDAFVKRKEELLKKGGHAYNDANLFGSEKALQSYATGQGFRGGVLNPGDVHEGLDELSELKSYFDMLKADGSDTVKSLQGAGEIFYKNGYKGISQAKVSDQAKRSMGTLITSPVGQQIGREYEMLKEQGGIPEGVSKADYLWGKFLGVGMGFTSAEYSTNLDAALNKASDRKREDEKEAQSFTVDNLPFNKSYKDRGDSKEYVAKNGKLVSKDTSFTVPMRITNDANVNATTPFAIIPAVASTFWKVLSGDNNKEVNMEDPKIATTIEHIRTQNPNYDTMSKEEQMEALAEHVDNRSKETMGGAIELTNNSKSISNLNNVLLPSSGSGEKRTIDIGAATFFEFKNQSGDIIPGRKLKEEMEAKGITKLSYQGTSQDISSPVEYGSTVLVGDNGEPFMMSPSQTDKASPAYFTNRILSASAADMYTREFSWQGEKFSSTQLPDGTFRVETSDGETAVYQKALNEQGQPKLVKIK